MKQSKPFVIVDTREQLPYNFPDWPVIKQALPSGDYSILGHEECFAIERKSLADLAGCIFQERFKNELKRLQGYRFAFLVIEANLYRISRYRPWRSAEVTETGEKKKSISPLAMIGFLQSIPLLYGVHVLYLDDRETAESYVRGLLEKYNRYLLNEKE